MSSLLAGPLLEDEVLAPIGEDRFAEIHGVELLVGDQEADS